MKKHPQEDLEKIWVRVKKKHLYPEIPVPKMTKTVSSAEGEGDPEGGVGLEMKQK